MNSLDRQLKKDWLINICMLSLYIMKHFCLFIAIDKMIFFVFMPKTVILIWSDQLKQIIYGEKTMQLQTNVWIDLSTSINFCNVFIFFFSKELLFLLVNTMKCIYDFFQQIYLL